MRVLQGRQVSGALRTASLRPVVRVLEAEFGGVQRLAAEAVDDGLGQLSGRRLILVAKPGA